MKRIFLSIMVAASLVACNTTEKVAVDRNADTQNPIMPIVFSGGDDFTQTIYLTDYLPQVKCFDSLVFTTEPSYQVLKVEEGLLTFTGDHTLSILKESAVRNAEPTLWELLILSSTRTIPDSGSSLYSLGETRPNSMFRSFLLPMI